MIYDTKDVVEGIKLFDRDGNLPAGFHEWSLGEIETNLVDRFPASETRRRNYEGYLRHRDAVSHLVVQAEQWIDGSFSTAKENPNDIDLLTIIQVSELEAMPLPQQQSLSQLFARTSVKQQYHCDSFLLPEYPKDHPKYSWFRTMRKYWYGEFSLDRNDQSKGIVRHKWESTQ
jgi:hypothetical protein